MSQANYNQASVVGPAASGYQKEQRYKYQNMSRSLTHACDFELI